MIEPSRFRDMVSDDYILRVIDDRPEDVSLENLKLFATQRYRGADLEQWR